MSNSGHQAAASEHVKTVRDGYAAALRGDFESLRVLAEDVRRHAAGDAGGCQNRREALV